MKRFHQTEWHGIQFDSFAELSATRLADASFYEHFYREFFRRYEDWSDLDEGWLAGKAAIGKLIAGRTARPPARVLSIGCGLGAVERQLKAAGVENLDITETSDAPLRWIKNIVGDQHVFRGFFPDCLPPERIYDLIYLSAVDYCFDRSDWIKLLEATRGRLASHGRCLVISASYYESTPWVAAKTTVHRLVRFLRGRPGQFWGWMRTRRDYRQAFDAVDFTRWQDGVTDDGVYWIEGTR